jgi:hypothetical protein
MESGSVAAFFIEPPPNLSAAIFWRLFFVRHIFTGARSNNLRSKRVLFFGPQEGGPE